MTLVYPRERQPDTTRSGLHVLIVGVGHYPVLGKPPNGFPTELSFIEPKLPGITASALKLVQWFETEYEGERPLASIRLLTNSPEAKVVTYSIDGVDTTIDAPTLDNVRGAARVWREDCDAHADNTAMFFFVGHGYQAGDSLGLTADFGADVGDPLRHAIALDSFVERMRKCRADLQAFFFDCCREKMDVLDPYRDDSQDPGDALLPVLGRNYEPDQPVIFSTLPDRKAYVQKNGLTLFVQSLLSMLTEAVKVEPYDGRWAFKFSGVLSAIKLLMEKSADTNAPPQFPNARSNIGENRVFALYQGIPTVRCNIVCNPSQAMDGAKMQLANSDTGVCKKREGDSGLRWRPTVPADGYNVTASYPDSSEFVNAKGRFLAMPGNHKFGLKVESR